VIQSDGPSTTHFLNVDLEITSKYDLQPLVQRLGRKVHVHYVGRDRGKYSARLEIAKDTKTADSTIRALCRLIEALPEAERSMWNAAIVRSFSIGIQAGPQPNPCDFVIRPQTLRVVSDLAAEIVFTIYALGFTTQAAQGH